MSRIQKKKKNLGTEYCDLMDPFIDDLELAIDERMLIAQTKQQDFSSKVALLQPCSPPLRDAIPDRVQDPQARMD